MLKFNEFQSMVNRTLHLEMYTTSGLTCPITGEQAIKWATKSIEAHKRGIIWIPPHVEVRVDTNTLLLGVPETWPNSILITP